MTLVEGRTIKPGHENDFYAWIHRTPLKVCRKSLYSAENIAAHTESTFAVALALLLLEARAWADDLLV